MIVPSLGSFVRNGHFLWCQAERTMVARECQRCHFQLYAGAFFVALLVAGIEFWGSRHTKSVSLWSDAWHMFSDGVGYGIGGSYAFLVSRHLLSRAGQTAFKQGCEFLLGALLVLSGLLLLVEVADRLWRGQVPVITESRTLLSVAVLGLIINIILLILFRAFGAGHVHAHHGHENKLLRGNFWHTFGDTASSALVVMNASIVSWSRHVAWGYLDLTISAVIAGILLWQGVVILAEENSNPQ